MRIVYGVSGEGLGHVFEAIEIVAMLRREGHTIKVLTYGDRAMDALRELAPTRIAGFPLYFNERGLDLPKTFVKSGIPGFSFYIRNWNRLMRELRDFGPDVFITAYEPFCTRAAHGLNRPLVSMDNQHALLYLRNSPPGYRVSLAMVKWATRAVSYGADHYIVKSYTRRDSPNEKVRFVGPLIQEEIVRLTPSVGDSVLVYLTKPNPRFVELLRTIDRTFLVYCEDRVGQEGNLVFRRRGPTFLPDLAGCQAIIGTTGFSLISDAFYLKKPYFGVPLKKQFEQTINAFFLAESGFGEFSEDPTPAMIRAFLERCPLYRERLNRHQAPVDPSEQANALRAVLRRIAAGAPAGFTDAGLALSPR